MDNHTNPTQKHTDTIMGRAIGAGLFRGAVIGSGAGLALGFGLQAMGILDSLTTMQMALFVGEVGLAGAVIGALWKGIVARQDTK